MTYAKDLRRPLLLLHGTADDNVYFRHTLKLANALFREGREFDLLPLMRKKSIPLMAYSPLDQGRLLTKPALKKLANGIGCTPAQLALAWVLRHGAMSSALIGASRVEQIEQNVAALGALELTGAELSKIDKICSA